MKQKFHTEISLLDIQIQSLKDTIDAAVVKKGEDGYYEALVSAKETYDTAVAGFEYPTLRNYVSNYWELMDALEEEENQSAQKVVDLINAIGEVTLESEDAIQEVREAYEALSAEQKEKVTNYATLVKARETYEKMKEAYHAFITGKPAVKAEALSYHSVKISWEPYEDTKSYYVYRKTKG